MILSTCALLPFVASPLLSKASSIPHDPAHYDQGLPTDQPGYSSPDFATTPPLSSIEGFPNYESFSLSASTDFLYNSLAVLFNHLPPFPILAVLMIVLCCAPTWAKQVVIPKIKESMSDMLAYLTIRLFYIACLLLSIIVAYYYPPTLFFPSFDFTPLLPSAGPWPTPYSLIGPAMNLLCLILLCIIAYPSFSILCPRFVVPLCRRAVGLNNVYLYYYL